ncbi:hypothetical protein J5N97_023263 [Dioscorea zingiberensis]|uniref:Protein kinase domain-containing protein n=1 Tax=Dioscorea zingiberensis TaxID=325984 RepID=A0A9D5CBQ2_9LILI|nr:hypothetical protein J5N97_023263 [Dioscorea zingiberensis]
MQNNRFNGTVPVGFGRLPKLQRLELASNELAGEIPDDIASSMSLSFIDLSHNHLQLPLPSNILSIPSLQSFMASDNELTGGIPDQFQDCPSLSALDLSNNKLSETIPASLASCERLVSLNLRSNAFTGDIPTAIAMMPTLAILDLSNNLLTGAIPDKFGSSPALETLNLSYNKLTGSVPENGMLRTINPDDLAGNSGLCGGVLPPCNPSSPFAMPSIKKGYHIKHIVTGWVIGVSAVLAAVIALLLARRLYRYWYVDGGCCEDRFDEENSAWPWRLTAFQRVSFTSSDVLACIKESNVLGMGATGIVYKADMPRHHAVVAVKKLWPTTNDGGVTEATDIAREVNLLDQLYHRNIVRLLGYLHNKTDTIFIYEYVTHRSLWEALHGNQAGRLLVDWVSRYNVAAEYGYTLKVDQKSDIYSFGVVLMELVTGRRPVEPEFGESQDIVGWVREKLSRREVEDVLDRSVGGQCKHVQEEMLLMLRIAVLCSARLPKDRPSMRDVLTMLGEAKPRRKSSSASVVSNVAGKDKPVFSTSPESEFL